MFYLTKPNLTWASLVSESKFDQIFTPGTIGVRKSYNQSPTPLHGNSHSSKQSHIHQKFCKWTFGQVGRKSRSNLSKRTAKPDFLTAKGRQKAPI